MLRCIWIEKSGGILIIDENSWAIIFCYVILQTFGVGSVAQMVLSNWKYGSFFSVNFGWGIGVTLGCYWAGGISGKLRATKLQ